MRAARGAQDLIFRAQNKLWRVQNRRKTFPQELLASDFEALEVSGAPRGDQESLQEVSKRILRVPKTLSRGLQELPRGPESSQDALKRPPRASERPQRGLRAASERPRRSLREASEKPLRGL